MASVDDNELLLRHAQRWANERGRSLDRDLLETALNLRATHDGYAANRWPTHSVEHLMLVRWPAHGPIDLPDPASLMHSLDTFWRFLRTTGRMAASSAAPAQLLQEAKKAAKRMAAACADPANYAASKSLLAYGRELGISMDDAPDMEALQDRFQRITEAWNALPIEERRRLSGDSVNTGSRIGQALTEAVTAGAHPGLPSGWSMPEAPRLDAPPGEDSYYPQDPAVTAPLIRQSGYVRALLALCEWLGDGREVTATGVLRPTVARQAYADLDLWSWDRPWATQRPDHQSGEDEETLRARATSWWRTAADCEALDRLWAPAVEAGLIVISGRSARFDPSNLPRTDGEWAQLGQLLLLALALRLSRTVVDPLLHVLVRLIPAFGGRSSTAAALQQLWWQSPANTDAAEHAEFDWARELIDTSVWRALGYFDDCGLWIHRHNRLAATDLAWDFTLSLITAMERGLFDDA